MKNIGIVFVFLFLSVLYVHADEFSPVDIAQIETLTGAKGELKEKSGVFKVSSPSKDLHVTAAGIKLNPASGLSSWASFRKMGSDVEVMGDLVVLENQVSPVMKKALEKGLHVTALHNHFFWDTPRLMFMHIEGMGTLEDLSLAIGTVFQEVKNSTDKKPPPFPKIIPADSTLNPRKIEAILEKKGVFKDGVYKLVWDKTTKMHGQEVRADMGAFIMALFMGTDQHAVVFGDIAMTEDEVQNVLKTLLKHDIFVVSLHHHMLGEHPKLIFVHYMGWGSTTNLSKALKEALKFTDIHKPVSTQEGKVQSPT